MTDSHILDTETATVPVGAITPHPANARRGDTAAIAASLREHGQYKPLTVQRSTGHILVGNNTYAAARDILGWDTVAVHYVDVDDDRARAILAVDNRSSDLAEYDDEKLLELLEGITPDAGFTGFDDDFLDELRRSTDALGAAAGAFLDGFANPTPDPVPHPGPDPAPAAANAAPAAPAAPGTAPAPAPAPVDYHGAPTPAPGAAPPVSSAPMFVPVTYTLSVTERDELRAAVRAAQANEGLDSQSDGLMAIARAYMADHA